jgi:hypothetical protein
MIWTRKVTYRSENSQVLIGISWDQAALRGLQHNRVLNRKSSSIVVVYLRSAASEGNNHVEGRN